MSASSKMNTDPKNALGAISGMILAVQRENDRTLLQITTGSNGAQRKEQVSIPGNRAQLSAGKIIKLTNFARAKDGTLEPGKDARVSLVKGALSAQNDANGAAKISVPITLARPTTVSPKLPAPPTAPLAIAIPKETPKAIGLIDFSDRFTRQEVFNRAVEVAREFAEHIRKSGQIIKIQERDYVTVAGWSLLPAFEAANCYTVSHEIRPDGIVIAEAIVEKNGVMVSRGFGACSEKDRPKINDRLAMAQTRARGSALKSRYSVLVTLAGYEASLADEVQEATPAPESVRAKAESAPRSLQQTVLSPAASAEQLDFALKQYGGDITALLADTAELGLLVFKPEEIPVSILKKLVEQKITERKNARAAAAATPAA